MTPEYFFNQLSTPSKWLFKGYNHNRNDDDEITVFGKVYDDRKSKIIRICLTALSGRCLIVERTRSANGTANYKTVCDIRAEEIDRINDFITKMYL